ncbi:hypothetical protein QQ008_12895 [Fulvivirgaceae bacterium BMA10]|uniref:Uncharacterized protein n=1 Tax=Splendidivirga corallicola TaxID=3051826 RepID=A0ABT8KS33_9BACT|nr:hypothetical protein [Fulvivirgaceae bacterium BMA10]
MSILRFIAFRSILTLFIFFLSLIHLDACTIFVLTDSNGTFFFNNEDYVNPNTRIWFIPAGKDYYGCGFVGYDDGSAQGGINTEGLAFDWYAGKPDDYVTEKHLVTIEGNSSERMLEMCATVDEAIAFYQTYAEPSFARSTILIADKTGASVIIGSKNGKLYFDRSNDSRALGYGHAIFQKLYSSKTTIQLESGAEILKQCVQNGKYATKYSNSYNLKTGDILIYNFSNGTESTTLNLFTELKKGEHYYEIPKIETQVNEALMPIELNMNRLILFEFQALPDQEPEITSLVKKIITEAAKGKLRSTHYSNDLWNQLKKDQDGIQSQLKELGKLISQHLIHKEIENEFTTYSYVMVFENARILLQFQLNKERKVNNIKTLSAYITRVESKKSNLKSGAFETIISMPYSLIVMSMLIIGFLSFIFLKRKYLKV